MLLPEETVILHTDFPQPFGRSMILELESHCALKLLRLLMKQMLGLSSTIKEATSNSVMTTLVMLTQKAIFQFLLVELSVCRVFLHMKGGTNLSWPDLNVKVVPLV